MYPKVDSGVGEMGFISCDLLFSLLFGGGGGGGGGG